MSISGSRQPETVQVITSIQRRRRYAAHERHRCGGQAPMPLIPPQLVSGSFFAEDTPRRGVLACLRGLWAWLLLEDDGACDDPGWNVFVHQV